MSSTECPGPTSSTLRPWSEASENAGQIVPVRREGDTVELVDFKHGTGPTVYETTPKLFRPHMFEFESKSTERTARP
jgi:hypothetical protein